MGTVRTEFDGGNRVLERNAVKHHPAAEVDEEAALVLVDGEEKHAVRRGSDSAYVAGGLDGKRYGL